MSRASFVFWLSAGFVAYVYAGYPAALHVWAWWRRRRPGSRIADHRAHAAAGRSRQSKAFIRNPHGGGRSPSPGVSIVIAARNEGPRLAARLDNLFSLEWSGARQIIVVSDGSTDNTREVLARYAGLVEVVMLSGGGKAAALNAGVARARHDIVVFADARQVFAPEALTALVESFRDPSIGAVTGELLLDAESELFSNRRTLADRRAAKGSVRPAGTDRRRADRRRPEASTITDGLGMYWRYEKHLRRLESLTGSMVGATGAIYAIRRQLWRPLPPSTILDDVLTPMRVVLDGYRVVFNERARAYDRIPIDADTEARRKVRTLAGNYQLAVLEPRVLLPWRNPVWLQYVSHKLARLGVPYALLTVFGSSIVLSHTSVFYAAALIMQVVFYLLAGYGAVIELCSRRRVRAAHRAVAAAAAREVA